MIEWKENKTKDLIWRFPKNRIYWNDEIRVGKNQAAALFTGFKLFSHPKLHGIFCEGNKLILSKDLPLVFFEFHKHKIEDSFEGTIIFCSTDEFDFTGKIYGGESYGSAAMQVSANAHCRLRIFDTPLFLKKLVGEKKSKSTADFLKFLKKQLGNALLYAGNINLTIELRTFGIELLEFTYDERKEKTYGFGA